MKKCIILANGKPPQKKIISFLFKKGYNKLICADGGANSALKLNLVPDFIIGDLDSISKETFNYYSGKSEIIRISRQNDTDVEKCLKFAFKKKYEECVLLGGIGNRLDHSFGNLGIVLKFSDRIKIKVIFDKSILTVEKGSVVIYTIPNEIISLYAFNNKTFISSKGLKYNLNKDILPFGLKESTSNIAKRNEIHLKIEGGKIFLIRDYNTVSRNGLF